MEYSSYTGNKTRVAPFVAVFCLLLSTSPALVARANAMTGGDELTPGSYVWNPSLASDGSLSMVVNLATQKAYIYRGGTLIGTASIASGKPHYETPDGTFTVIEKERFHRSNKYDDAPMPYMQRLTWSGLALHGGHPRGHPASHGCIRMPMGFAAALFKEDTKGMKVVITGQAPTRAQTMIANRQKAPAQRDNLQQTEFSSGQDEPNAVAPAVSGSVGSGEANDEAGYSAPEGDSNSYPEQSEHDQRYYGSERRVQDRDVPRDVPPEDLPPPPN